MQAAKRTTEQGKAEISEQEEKLNAAKADIVQLKVKGGEARRGLIATNYFPSLPYLDADPKPQTFSGSHS